MLRFIQVSDAESAARISRAARFEAIPNYPDLHTTEEDLAFYTKEITQSSGYVAEREGGSVIGLVIWRNDFIRHIYIDLGYQHQGIGTALMNKAMESMNCATVKLWTFQKNAKAVSFYKKLGFSVIAETDGENEENLPDFLFAFERWS